MTLTAAIQEVEALRVRELRHLREERALLWMQLSVFGEPVLTLAQRHPAPISASPRLRGEPQSTITSRNSHVRFL